LFFTAGEGFAQDDFGCFIEATKVAQGAGDAVFEFVVQTPSGTNSFFLQNGEANSGILDEGNIRTTTEAPQHGYILQGIECQSLGGLIVTNFEGGFTLECANAKLGTATCTIFNVRDTSAIPTLSEWGMISAAAGLALIGVFFAIKRLRASKQSDAIG
jgi:hypothetical protein